MLTKKKKEAPTVLRVLQTSLKITWVCTWVVGIQQGFALQCLASLHREGAGGGRDCRGGEHKWMHREKMARKYGITHEKEKGKWIGIKKWRPPVRPEEGDASVRWGKEEKRVMLVTLLRNQRSSQDAICMENIHQGGSIFNSMCDNPITLMDPSMQPTLNFETLKRL